MTKKIDIEIWTDIACPWCYIGKTNLELALGKFQHKDSVNINIKAFQIAPNIPVETGNNLDEMLSQLHNLSLTQAHQMNNQIVEKAKESGLLYDMQNAVATNSLDALRLVYLARESKLENQLIKRFMKAYLEERLHIGRHDVLQELATEVGLSKKEVIATLESDIYEDEIVLDRTRAEKIGLNGVPFFIFNQKYAVSGAQPVDTFSQILKQVWEETDGN